MIEWVLLTPTSRCLDWRERERDGGPITQIIGLERRKVADNCLGSSSSLTFLWQHGGGWDIMMMEKVWLHQLCNHVTTHRSQHKLCCVELVADGEEEFWIRFCFRNGAQLYDCMPNSVSKGFDTAMKTSSSRRFKRHPTTYRWVSSWLPFTVD